MSNADGTVLVVEIATSTGRCVQATTTLIVGAQRAGAELETHLRNSLVTRERHAELMRATDAVSVALAETLTQARAGMEDLNGTVASMKDALRHDAHEDWMHVLRQWLQHAAVQVLRGAS